jgi:hypothetical protein
MRLHRQLHLVQRPDEMRLPAAQGSNTPDQQGKFQGFVEH